jgi:NDP-sugar pyrophosphorylase family protein
VKVVLMCGGIGKRMTPLTKDKSLLQFSGKPLLLHQINCARNAGIDDFIIIANPENIDPIQTLLSSLQNVRISYAVQEKSLGMANALLSTASLIGKEPFILVSSNDLFTSMAYTQLLHEYQNNNFTSYITALRIQEYFPGGYLKVKSNAEIERIIEKPPKGEEPSDLINIVIHLHKEPEILFSYLSTTESTSDDIYEKTLDRMIEDGYKIKAVPYTEPWQAIKYPWHILDTMDYFAQFIKSDISPGARISNKAIIDGNVIIEDKVRVFEGAIIRGPSYIGRNSVIGNGALIRDSSIGNDCVVGYSTEIKHSYIGNGCWFHSNYIGDSVIEDDCSFGAGAITANFRLDETIISSRIDGDRINTGHDKLGAVIGRGCRIGINSSIMPGITIGANSFVGAHINLTHNLETGKMALSKSEYMILPNLWSISENKREDLMKKFKQ